MSAYLAMWVARFSFKASKALIGGIAVRNKVSLHVYPFYIQECAEGVRVSFFIIFNQDAPEKFVSDLKKSKRTVYCYSKRNILQGQIIEPLGHGVYYNPEIVHLRPWVVDAEKNVEHFVVASRRRKCIERIAESIKEKHLGRMDYVRWKDVHQFFIIDVVSNVTQKQREALDIALKHGYYDYPKRTDLRALARIMKVSYATYQAHLKKAEKRLLPRLAGEAF